MQTSPKQDSVEQLERLSSRLQGAGIPELELLVPQLVVARRENSYNEHDLRFIKASLHALMPQHDFEAVLKRVGEKKQGRRLDRCGHVLIEAGDDWPCSLRDEL